MSVHFPLFFDYYHTRLIKLAMVFVPKFDQAEEVVSEVFLKLLRKNGSLLTIQHLEGYLFKMVKDENMSHKQVSEILERTVEVHLKLAIQDLRKSLGNYYDEHELDIPVSKQRFLSLFL